MERHLVEPVDDEYLRRLIREADEDVAQGRVGVWDAEEIKREGRRILAERQARHAQ
jgi:predicted kinase